MNRRYRRLRPWELAPRPTVSEPRPVLIEAVLDFVRDARLCPGVTRIALIGSLTTHKPIPKDADVVVTLDDDVDWERLAKLGRQLKGRTQRINLGADIFLANAAGHYIGRVCGYRECHARVLCQAHHCGERQHLNDDFHLITLTAETIRDAPFELWPRVERRGPAPEDVEQLLLVKLEGDASQPEPRPLAQDQSLG